MRHFLDFEKPLAELEGKIEELRHLADGGDLNIADEVEPARGQGRPAAAPDLRQAHALAEGAARAPSRPAARRATTSPRCSPTSRRSPATAPSPRTAPSSAGSAASAALAVVVIAHEKGGDTEARVKHNFGMARPEGYRKARRLMRLAERFRLPVLTFVDTAGAYPGIDAEARGQAEAIARSIEACLR